MIYIGIDPGKSGAIAMINELPTVVFRRWIKLAETPRDVIDWLPFVDPQLSSQHCVARIEKVHSSPQMGVKSAFSFGQSFGWLLGVLDAKRIPYEFVSPQKWQKHMGCLTKGDKNVSKAAAQRLWPSLKITHANADALLIAEYCRRTHR